MNLSLEMYDFIKIIASVFLGMFGKSAYDYFVEYREIRRDKKFIVDYFKNAKNLFPVLKENYQRILQVLPNIDNTIHEFKLFEGFNTEVLKSISFPRYYHIFGQKAATIYEIYNIVNSLKGELPISIYSKHLESLKNIYSNPDIKTDENIHELETNLVNLTEATIKMKLQEIELLEKRIDMILQKKIN